jgi:hypothetical protein
MSEPRTTAEKLRAALEGLSQITYDGKEWFYPDDALDEALADERRRFVEEELQGLLVKALREIRWWERSHDDAGWTSNDFAAALAAAIRAALASPEEERPVVIATRDEIERTRRELRRIAGLPENSHD